VERLSPPDAIALAVADLVAADAVWTFDRRWSGVHPRVAVPAA
jgi:predicted nucleic acid-binding protein